MQGARGHRTGQDRRGGDRRGQGRTGQGRTGFRSGKSVLNATATVAGWGVVWCSVVWYGEARWDEMK